MNPTNLKLDIQAFLDGELNSGRKLEVERLLATDPAAAELHARLRSVRDLVRNSEPRPVLNESRDFYWSQIQRRIAQGERESQRRTAHRSPILRWVRWAVPVTGLAALALILSLPKKSSLQTSLAVPEFESNQAEASGVTYRSEADGVTVHWMN